MRGKLMSSAKRVWPLHLARASTLRNGLPMTLRGLPWLPLFIAIDNFPRRFRVLAAHARRRQFNRFINLDVAGAAAEIARQRFLNLYSGRAGILFEQFLSGQQKGRRAIAALRRAEVGKGLLQRVQL